MTFRLTRDVRLLATGLIRAAGSPIAPDKVPPPVWERWLQDGIVVPAAPPAERADEAVNLRREPAVDYSQLSWRKLRRLARERGLQGRSALNKAELVALLEQYG